MSGARHTEPRGWESPSLCPTSLQHRHLFWSIRHLAVPWNVPAWYNRDYLEWNLSVFQKPQKSLKKDVSVHDQTISYPFSPISTLTDSLHVHNWAWHISLLFAQKQSHHSWHKWKSWPYQKERNCPAFETSNRSPNIFNPNNSSILPTSFLSFVSQVGKAKWHSHLFL